MGQNLSLKMEAVGDSTMKAVHANRAISWIEPNKRYSDPPNIRYCNTYKLITMAVNCGLLFGPPPPPPHPHPHPKCPTTDHDFSTAYDHNKIFTHTCCSCEIPMGDLQSEEERDIVLELKLPALASPAQDTVLRTTLSYFNVINSELDTIQSDLVLSRGGEMVASGTRFLLTGAACVHFCDH